MAPGSSRPERTFFSANRHGSPVTKDRLFALCNQVHNPPVAGPNHGTHVGKCSPVFPTASLYSTPLPSMNTSLPCSNLGIPIPPHGLVRHPLARAWIVICLLPLSVPAQPETSHGSIEGRVFNRGTQSYVRNVRIEVSGTPLQAFTDSFGAYALRHVPAGTVTLNVFYTGSG